MGRKLNLLLGRNFRASKFRPLLTLALSRLAILSNQRRLNRSLTHSDLLQLLQLPNHHRALLRVEMLIKDQNILDAYDLIDGYLNLLIERTNLLEQERECPEELKEAVSGLIFAASRCGDFPELQQIKSIFTTHFGKEFTARAVELRNNCGVSHLLMQKLSTRQPNLESRMDMLKAIASENGIALQLQQSPPSTEENLARNTRQNQPEPHGEMEVGENLKLSTTEIPSGSSKQKYKDVADAAQAAFESAAQAAAAARAALELSRSEPQHPGSGTSPQGHEKQEPKKTVVESKLKWEIIENRTASKISAEVKEEDVNTIPACSSSSRELCDKENREMGEERNSNLEIGLDMETKVVENTEVMEKPSFRLNLEKKPMSVRTRRMRGY